ncbi:dephospho-CoA kinase [Thermocrinis sp.]
MFNWKKYEDKLLMIKAYIENEGLFGPEVDAELVLPNQEDFELKKEIPYIRVHFYIDEQHRRTRIIELFEYYLEKDLTELTKLIKDMIEEFVAESESTEYGGG